jgi:arginine deiminase
MGSVMPNSRAFSQFKESLVMAEELLRIERERCHNPPRLEEQKTAQGLRGGAVVLMAATFENFLKQAFEEHLAKLTSHPPILLEKLPEKMRINCVFFTLNASKMIMRPERVREERLAPYLEQTDSRYDEGPLPES